MTLTINTIAYSSFASTHRKSTFDDPGTYLKKNPKSLLGNIIWMSLCCKSLGDPTTCKENPHVTFPGEIKLFLHRLDKTLTEWKAEDAKLADGGKAGAGKADGDKAGAGKADVGKAGAAKAEPVSSRSTPPTPPADTLPTDALPTPPEEEDVLAGKTYAATAGQ